VTTAAAPDPDSARELERVVADLRDANQRLVVSGIRMQEMAEHERRRLEAEAEAASLRKLNHIKDEFLATLSHELRTPLSAILGWSHVLASDTGAPGARQQAIAAIQRNARAQAQLIDDLLDISRIVSGKLQIAAECVPLESVIDAAVDTVRLSATAKGVDLQVTLDPHASLMVNGDPARLQQIVWNLLSNAIKFTPARGRVDVELREVDRTAEIVVRDTGEGIEASVLPHVFDRFWQRDSRASRRYGGLGLGLAIVRHLCEAHGGTVSAASDGAQRGAVFTVRLPLESAVPREVLRPSARIDDDAPVLKDRRVLVVDDNADARFLATQMLTAQGADVVVVASADDALRQMQTRCFDAIVADIAMPDEDGYALIKKVRRLSIPQGGQIPAVAVTAYASLHDREQALAAGFDRHVAKPVEPHQLAAAIAGAIASRQASRSTDASSAAPAVPEASDATRPAKGSPK